MSFDTPYAEHLEVLLTAPPTPVRQAFKHNHPLSLAHPPFLDLILPRDCQACRVERRLKNAKHEYEDDGTDIYPYVELAWCRVHGPEPVTGYRSYRTGYDTGIAGEFACGLINEEDVF